MKRRALVALAAVLALGVTGAAASAAQAEIMNVYGTSDISDSALMPNVIKPGFETYSAEHGTKYEIEYHSSGTTQALEEAAKPENKASAVLVHAISAEREWVEKGNSFHTNEWGYALFYNDFVVLGPTGDPAGVGTGTSATEAKEAFKKIAFAGHATPSKATFVSRGDASGTNIKEQEIWSELKTELETAGIAMTTITAIRAKPTPASNPWYKETLSKQGKNLEQTNACSEPGWTPETCYTIVDRGSYYNLHSQGKTSKLKIVTQEPAPPSGELTNVFRGYIPKPTPNVAASEELYTYLQSEGFQAALGKFISPTEQSFVPNAAPHLAGSVLPTTAKHGAKIKVSATFDYAPPIPPSGSHPPFVGVGAELLRQPHCVGSFVGTGLTGTTEAAGKVTFEPTVGTSGTLECFEVKTKPLTVSAVPFESQFAGSTYTKLGASENGRVKLT